MSTRKLTYYEQKLLKHSNLYNWDTDRNDVAVQSKYGITKRQQLVQYRQTAKKVRDFVDNLTNLPKDDPVRLQLTQKLSQFLYQYNLVDSPQLTLQQLKNFSADRLMSRRIVYMLKQMKFAPTIDAACNFVKTGQISIGPNVITNINYHLKPGEEDYLTWTQVIDPLQIQDKLNLCGKEVQNRYLRSATALGAVTEQGYPTENYYKLYKRISQSKPGIIMNEITCISKDGYHPRFVQISSDDLISYHKRLTDLVKAETDHKTLIGCQIVHSGFYRDINSYKIEEFDQIIEDFKQAAIRVEKAGYDLVQIHAAHQFLLEQSISDFYNKRTDIYNPNDFILLQKVFQSVKDAVSIPVGVKINSNDFIENHTMNSSQLRKILEKIPFDFVEISGGSNEGKFQTIRRSKDDKYYYKEEIHQIEDLLKDRFVIVTGGFDGSLDTEMEALEDGVSMIGYSRMFIRQPDFVQKPISERLKCIRCNGCLKRFGQGQECICVFDKDW